MNYPRHLIWQPVPKARREVTPIDRPRWSRKKIWKTAFACSLLAILTFITVVALGFTLLVLRVRGTVPSIAKISAFQPATATNIYSSDGILLATLQMENRQVVQLKNVSPDLINATLAVEDSRFYEHSGVDLKGVARAFCANLINRDATSQGASTITQQLARNVNAFGLGKTKSLSRKVREAMTAIRIEQVFSKDEILELYLNQIYYGSGAYGIEAASRTYFGKPASRLSIAEAALLAGIPQRPNAYSPYTNLTAAQTRRNVVLKRMLDTGKISIADYERAKSEAIHLAGRKTNHTVYRAPYFVDWVVQGLVARYGVDAVYSGWKVVTTLDWRMQQAAEKSLRQGLRSGATQGALVCIDPHTGDVRAMVGGVDYQKDRFNAVTQGKRQPGSAFKPIVYATAIDTGAVSLDTKIKDEPLKIPTGNGTKMWTVHNYGGGYRNQDVTVLDGITSSINTVAVEAAQETGINRVIEYAQKMGITTELAPYLPLALGSSAVRPIELCSAYGIFASEGDLYKPISVQSITDGAGKAYDMPSAFERRQSGILQPATILQMNEALHSVVQNGTGYAAAVVPYAFGKTGTTSDSRDAWFVGYTPDLVAAVWVAHPDRDARGIVHYAVMPGATGGHVAAPIWAGFMRTAAPIQKRVNQLRGKRPWTITLPPPPAPEAKEDLSQMTMDMDAGSQGINLKGPFPGEQYDRNTGVQPEVYYQNSRPNANYAQAINYGSASDNLKGASRGSGENLVEVCADTGQLATEWCDTTTMVDFTGRKAPTGSCRKHHAPAGESQ
jgi:penicillin-binding protein 1A